MTGRRVLLGISGGTDSAYAAQLLKKDGYTVEGAVLKMHEYTDTLAASVAAKELDIPLHIVDCTKAFYDTVVENFLDEYQKARTPNPCIVCNREVKFKFLLEYAEKNGFDYIATGHYAKKTEILTEDGVRYTVSRPADLSKDQTYMLYRLSQEELKKLLLPLAEEYKDQARLVLRENGVSAADSPDSQEICFIPDNDYAAFIKERRTVSPKGNFIDREGRVLGEHNGIINYTVGQRKGLGIALGARAFVTDINPADNTVTLDTSPKESSVVYVSSVIFSGMSEPKEIVTKTLSVKLRYRARAAEAEVTFYPDGRAKLLLKEPQRSVTPGQSAVFYEGETVLAGGFIDGAE